MKKITTLSLSIYIISSCSTALDIYDTAHKTDFEIYDDTVCHHGEPLPPSQPKRAGCVNDKSEQDNFSDFLHYKKEREEYFDEASSF